MKKITFSILALLAFFVFSLGVNVYAAPALDEEEAVFEDQVPEDLEVIEEEVEEVTEEEVVEEDEPEEIKPAVIEKKTVAVVKTEEDYVKLEALGETAEDGDLREVTTAAVKKKLAAVQQTAVPLQKTVEAEVKKLPAQKPLPVAPPVQAQASAPVRVPKEIPRQAAVAAGKVEKAIPPPTALDGVYRFTDFFPEVKAKLYNRKTGEFMAPGVLKDDTVTFQGLATMGDISLLPVDVVGAPEKAISFNLIPGSLTQLTFHDFHPGQKLTVDYLLLQKFRMKIPDFVYLKIRVGSKEIKRIQISSLEAWKKEEIDLGIVSFLNRGVSISFEVETDNIKGLRLNLIPKIKN